jgi:putative ATP-binding cassette transporter
MGGQTMAQENKEQQDFSNTPYILVSSHKGSDDIHIKNLTVKLPVDNGRVLVDNVSMTLKKGDRVVLTGESGSGKTTFTKALLNLWDFGSGLVSMPENIKIIPIAQQSYFSDTTLRSIMNMAPEQNCLFEDKELARSLSKVGLARLVQHIPGQQVEILMEELLSKITDLIKNSGEETGLYGEGFDDFKINILSLIEDLTQEQFEVVQYVPQEQKDSFARRLRENLDNVSGGLFLESQIEELESSVLSKLDFCLARPLYNHLAKAITETAPDKRGIIVPRRPSSVARIGKRMEKKLARRLRKFIANKDTDDINRIVRLNEAQAEDITSVVAGRLCEEFNNCNQTALQILIESLNNNSDTDRVGKFKKLAGKGLGLVEKPLRYTFGTAMWPLRALNNWRMASVLARDFWQSTTFFMARQVVTGNQFSTSGRLSGGQKQMLTGAIGLVHNADFYILDEITAAMDRENGEKLYKDLMDSLPPDATVLSIAHNSYIWPYHDYRWHLKDKKISVLEVDKPEEVPESGAARNNPELKPEMA